MTRFRTTIKLVLLVAGILAFHAAAHAQARYLERVTRALASPQFEGRGTAQPGGAAAARFIEKEFRNAGLRPLPGQASILMPLDVRPYRFGDTASLSINGRALRPGEEFVPNLFGLARARPISEAVHGDMVFVGFGLSSKSLKHDDLSGIDLRNKVAVMIGGVPDDATALEWGAVEPVFILQELGRRGAKAVLVVVPGTLQGLRKEFGTRRGLALWDLPADFPKLPPSLLVSGEALAPILSAEGVDLADLLVRTRRGEMVSRPLKGRADVNFAIEYERAAQTFNVVGYVPGSDPKMRDNAVFMTAHYDGYGNENGRVFPGAGDNAAGVAMMLSVARELALKPPARSVVFAALGAHEVYHSGSFQLLNSDAWQSSRISANINVDGIGSEAWGPLRVVHAPGFEQTDIGEHARAVAREMRLALVPDTFVQTRLFQRSDGIEFARRGIPSAYYVGYPATFEELGSNFDEAYRHIHFEGDQVTSNWDWQGTATMAKFFANVVRRVANDPREPQWTAGSPFAGRGRRPWAEE